jgi:hypothetical protein
MENKTGTDFRERASLKKSYRFVETHLESFIFENVYVEFWLITQKVWPEMIPDLGNRHPINHTVVGENPIMG